MGFKTRAKKTYGKAKKAYAFGKKHENTARKALKLAMSIKRAINTEYKYFDVTATALPSTTASFINLCQPSQGDSVVQRDGDSIKLARMSGRIILQKNSAATITTLRCILFRGKAENAVSYAGTDLLETISVVAPKANHEKFRTKILYDKIYTLNADKSVLTFDWNFKLFGHCNFTAAGTNVEDGGLYLMLLSSEVANFPSFNYYFRTTFTDN